MEISLIAAYIVGLIAVYLLGRVLMFPVKLLWTLIYNGIVGGISLWIVNLIGGLFGFTLGINFISVMIAGFLGVPGVLILVIYKYMFG